MSEARWCDIGQHAFSGSDPGKTVVKLEKQVKNQWGGYQPHDVVQEACAICSSDSGLKQLQLDPGLSEEEVVERARRVRDEPHSFRPGARALGVGPDPEKIAVLEYMKDHPEWKPWEDTNT